MSILAGLAAGAGLGVVQGSLGSAIQYHNQKALNEQAQRNYERNLKLQQKLNLQSSFQQVANSTAALRAAGISPVVATGANFNAPATTAPMQSSSAGMPNVDVLGGVTAGVGASLAKGQSDLMSANERKLNADAEAQEIQNERERNRDSSVNAASHVMLQEMLDTTDNPFTRGLLETYLDEADGNFDVGRLRAFSETFFDLSQRERDRELDFLAKEQDKLVLQKQFDNDAATALADMPRALRFQLYKNIALLNAQIGSLENQTPTKEDFDKKYAADISKTAQEVQSLLHNDPAAMWQAGDITSLLVVTGADAAKAFAGGAGFAAGTAVTRGAGAAGSIGSLTPKMAKVLKKVVKPSSMSADRWQDAVNKAARSAYGDPRRFESNLQELIKLEY